MKPNFIKKLEQNISPDLGTIIDESLSIFKKTVWLSGLGFLLLCMAILPIMIFVICNVMEINSMDQFVKMSPTLNYNYKYLITNACIGIGLAPFTTPLIAGLYKINHLAKQNKQFNISNLFNYYSGKYFMHLAISGFLIAAYTNILGLGLTYINLPIFAFIIQLFIAFLFIYSIPLIIFEEQSALNALANSSKIAMKHPLAIILTGAFAFLIAFLGVFALCIGMFFTMGYLYTMNYTLYSNIIPIDENTKSEEIIEKY